MSRTIARTSRAAASGARSSARRHFAVASQSRHTVRRLRASISVDGGTSDRVATAFSRNSRPRRKRGSTTSSSSRCCARRIAIRLRSTTTTPGGRTVRRGPRGWTSRTTRRSAATTVRSIGRCIDRSIAGTWMAESGTAATLAGASDGRPSPPRVLKFLQRAVHSSPLAPRPPGIPGRAPAAISFSRTELAWRSGDPPRGMELA